MSDKKKMSEERKKRIEKLGYDIPTENEIEYKKIQSCRNAFANFIGFTYQKLVKERMPFLEHKDFKILGLSHFTVNDFIRYCQERSVIAVMKRGNSVAEVYLPIENGESKLEKWAYFCRKKILGEPFNFTDFEDYGNDKKTKKLGEFGEKEESEKNEM